LRATAEVLSNRALNRALLERQMLLERREGTAAQTLEHLVGMQGQVPLDPYLGLWSRLKDFDPAPLGALLTEREVVRAPLMRSTLHMVTARDLLTLRPVVQSVLERHFRGSPFARQLEGVDLEALRDAGRALMEEKPRTRAELSRLLTERWPDHDSPSLAYGITFVVPLVQVPPRGVWGASGQATWTTAESWLLRPLEAEPATKDVILRYLAAFGPASVMDFQQWSGLTRIRELIEAMRPRLRSFRDESGVELFDVPDAPLPDPDTPAPVRFLPHFDNVLLSHSDRGRLLPDVPHAPLFRDYTGTVGGLLVDGFFRGLWTREREEESVTLLVEVTERLSKRHAAEVTAEGLRMLEFTDADAESRDIRITHRG
jgi:hypothetical protein